MSQFPPGFLWGAATAALQIEGASAAGGRTPSVWDDYCRDFPERIHQGATPEVACDHYHRYREDVEWMARLGHNAYRFSISWPRIFPAPGRFNQAGMDFYLDLVGALETHGIQPLVTLYHWDLPSYLGSWLEPGTVDHFVEFARACFEQLGSRVPYWMTLNEPGWSTMNGYLTGIHPPGLSDPRLALKAGHHLNLAHARAVQAYREGGHRGRIGVALNLSPIRPASEEDGEAATLADSVLNRFFVEPALLGAYPEKLLACLARENYFHLGEGEAACLRAAAPVDFLGVNYYYPKWASRQAPETAFHLNNSGRRDPQEDCKFSLRGQFSFVKRPGGRYTEWDWEIEPQGLTEILLELHRLSPQTPLIVTENGVGTSDDGCQDDSRIDFLREHLQAVAAALEQGVDVRGYLMWSLLDNFSWVNGYRKRYGFLRVDPHTLERTPRDSAWWFRRVALGEALSAAP